MSELSDNLEALKDYDVNEWRPRLGINLERAIAEAIIISSATKKPFTFPFNDLKISVEPVPLKPGASSATDDPEFAVAAEAQLQAAMAKAHAEIKAKSDAYLASPQYAADKAAYEADVVRRQNTVNGLMARLADVSRQGEVAILQWLSKLASVADHVGVNFDKKYLSRRLTSVGYRANAGVGRTKFDTRHKVAEFVIGQAISMADKNYPPHPIIVDWVEECKQKFTFAR